MSAFDPATFDHRDAGQYLKIAEHGYRASTHCDMGPRVHLCGNVTWFPGYPALIRMLGLTGLRNATAALAIAWACWYLTLLMVWVLSTDTTHGDTTRRDTIRHGTPRGIACLALAAFFPGQVYFAALFPISLAAFAVLLCIWLATRPSRVTRNTTVVQAALAGVVAGLAYPLAFAAAPALLATTFHTQSRRVRAAMFAGAGAVIVGVGLVFAYAQLRVGHWDAYSITEREEYGVRTHNPLDMLIARYHQLMHPSSSTLRIITQQGAFATLMLVVAGVVTIAMLARDPRGAALTDLALLGTACVAWLIPYVGAGQLSVYRSEACLIVLVPLLRRLPVWAIGTLACAAALIAYNMAPLFFSNALM